MKTHWKRDDVTRMIQDLSRIIGADGVVTGDELKLIESIESDLIKFTRSYMKALADNVITQEEDEELKRLWERMYDNAVKVARGDGVITADERNILLRVMEKVSEN
ncbi:MAG TPA: hypothetical protein VJ044_13090 [Candidatus Hodarchaeales archaeon]|nr:hypothetical protein [Candidatus Hodarchaeales archaeon]